MDYEKHAKLVAELYSKIKDGMEITFTPSNVAEDDNFLIFSFTDTIKVKLHTNRVPFWVEFDCDEPMRLEDCPDSFYRSILKNI